MSAFMIKALEHSQTIHAQGPCQSAIPYPKASTQTAPRPLVLRNLPSETTYHHDCFGKRGHLSRRLSRACPVISRTLIRREDTSIRRKLTLIRSRGISIRSKVAGCRSRGVTYCAPPIRASQFGMTYVDEEEQVPELPDRMYISQWSSHGCGMGDPHTQAQVCQTCPSSNC